MSHEETMVCHWLIDSNNSALSSQHPQTLRFFPREVKNIKHDRYFPQGLERSNPHENYPHTRATCWANLLARRLAQQVALVCGVLNEPVWLYLQICIFYHGISISGLIAKSMQPLYRTTLRRLGSSPFIWSLRESARCNNAEGLREKTDLVHLTG
jgi:hypothetical protein